MSKQVHRWNNTTKTVVILVALVLLALVTYRFQDVIPPLAIAFLLAFILSPLVGFLTNRLRIPRGLAAALVLLVLVVGLIATPIAAVPSIQEGVRSAQGEITGIINEIGNFLTEQPPAEILGYTINLTDFYDQISGILNSFVSIVAQETLNIVLMVASGVLWLIFILMIAYYLLKDGPRIIEQIDRLPPLDYREDFVRLRKQVTEVWHAFLRGQLLLCAVIAIITTLVCWIAGLPYPGALGLLAGLLEIVPNIGPTLAAVPAILLALFEGSRSLPISNFWYAVLVAGLYVLIQQIENNFLVPRIMGYSLNLHPVLVLIGVVIGGSVGGILGMLLAAPTLATLRVLGRYVFFRVYDLDPFAEPEEKPPRQPGPLGKARRHALNRLRRKRAVQATKAQIRPGELADRPAVEEICARVFKWEDYVPAAWEEWVADPHGQLAVAEVDGQIVGFGKLSRLEEDEWWLEGLRIDPDHQGKGIGGQLQAHLLDQARHLGHGTLRYGTHSLNEPIHHISARHGLRKAAVYRSYGADPLPPTDGPLPRQLTEADIPAAWALISRSPRYQAASGLHEISWQWKGLKHVQLARHLESGDGWGMDINGELAALALAQWSSEDQTLHFGYVDGLDEALVILLQGLRRLAAQRGQPAVKIKPVDEPALVAAVEAAGYERSWDRDIWIFEKPLEEETQCEQTSPS